MLGKRIKRSEQLALLACALGVAAAAPASAATIQLDLPGVARPSAERTEPLTSARVPVGPFANGGIHSIRAEGALTQRAWRIEESDLTTMQILHPLRDQLIGAGFEIVYECETRECGGFDFRYGMDVLPEPEMHVDLGDFRYLAAQITDTEDETPRYLSLLVSRTERVGYVQVTRVGAATEIEPIPVTSTKGTIEPEVVEVAPAHMGEALGESGLSTLDDLVFETGSAELGVGEFESLVSLSEYLNGNPSIRVALVGHTDAVGSLNGNIALSKRRAQSVAQRLVGTYGVSPAQVEAQGVGYLSPRASNQTEEGRRLNRRVEVIVSSVN